MKDRIGFIAIGQAGGNIGKLFEEKGYTVLYLNTSREDLETLGDAKYTYHIADGDGCNKDRGKAKRLVVEDFDNISREIYEKMDVSMVYVVFASGGGTGSGCGPMLIDLLIGDVRENPGHIRNVGAITVIPGEGESVKAHINCYECFGELTSIEGIASTLVIDNSRGDKLQLNRSLVNTFCNFLDIPRWCKDKRGNIDRAEIEETLKARGMLVVSRIPARKSSTASVLESFRNGIFAPIEQDRVIKYIAIASSGDVDVPAIQKEAGVPVDVFQTYSDRATICCLAGLNYPVGRLEQVYQKAVKHQEQIIRNMQATSGGEMKKGVNFLESSGSQDAGVPRQKGVSRRDLLKKYMG